MKLIIHCSSDRLQLRVGEEYMQRTNRGLEVDFSDILIDYIVQYNVQEVFVINGPGSFTTLRVVCLLLNLYNATHNNVLTLYTQTKTALMQKLLAEHEAGEMAMYIGQRINVWLYNYHTGEYSMRPKHDLPEGILFDDVSEEYSLDVDRMLYYVHDDMIGVRIGGHNYERSLYECMDQVGQLVPHYLMEPNISQ